MSSFFDYLVASTKEFRYRIRTVIPIDDQMMDRIEYLLSKYDIVSIDGPKKTIMQSHPLDFSTFTAAEIYIIDIVTHIPVSPQILQQEIRHVLGIPDSEIIIRSQSDPNEIQFDRQAEMYAADEKAAKDGLRPASLLSTDPLYPEYEKTMPDEPIAGEEYTKRFLQYLAKIAAERQPVIAPVKKNKMFNFLQDVPLDPEYYKDSPRVKPVVVKPGAKIDPLPKTSPYGNFDDTIKNISKAYVDKNGDEIVITSKKVQA